MFSFKVGREEWSRIVGKFRRVFEMGGESESDILLRVWPSGNVKLNMDTRQHYLEAALAAEEVEGSGAVLFPFRSLAEFKGEDSVLVAGSGEEVAFTCGQNAVSIKTKEIGEYPLVQTSALLDASFMVEESWLASRLDGVCRHILSGNVGDKETAVIKFNVDKHLIEGQNCYGAIVLRIPRCKRCEDCKADLLLRAVDAEFLLELLDVGSESNVFLIHDTDREIVMGIGFLFISKSQNVKSANLQGKYEDNWAYSFRVSNSGLQAEVMQMVKDENLPILIFAMRGKLFLCGYSDGDIRAVPVSRNTMSASLGVGVNPAYLAAACAMAGGEDIVIHGNGCEDVVTIDGDDCQCLVMPVRLSDMKEQLEKAEKTAEAKLS